MLWSRECQLQPAQLWPLFARGETRRDANERYSIGWRMLGVVRTERGGGGLAWMEEFTFVILGFVYAVSRALRGGRGKEEPLSAIATVLHAAPGDDGLPPPGPPRHTSAAQCLTARTREASPCAGYPAHGSACQPRIHASVVRAHGIQAFARQRRG